MFFLDLRHWSVGEDSITLNRGGERTRGHGIHTCQIIRRTLFLRPGQRVVDEGFVLAQARKVAGLAARRADGREGGTFLQGRSVSFDFFILGRELPRWGQRERARVGSLDRIESERRSDVPRRKGDRPGSAHAR